MVQVSASLDTSFWTAAHRAGVLAPCLRRFELNVPGAVVSELTFDPARQSRPYESQNLFRHLHGQVRFAEYEPRPIAYPDAGEAAAIALAAERGWVLLCNDRGACHEAASHGVFYTTTPDFIAFLCEQRELTFADAHARLEAIRTITAGEFVESAEAQLDRLRAARQRATDLARRRSVSSRQPRRQPHRHGPRFGPER